MQIPGCPYWVQESDRLTVEAGPPANNTLPMIIRGVGLKILLPALYMSQSQNPLLVCSASRGMRRTFSCLTKLGGTTNLIRLLFGNVK